MPMLLHAFKYNRRTKREEFIEVRAQYATGSRRVMNLCLGDVFDGEKPIQFCANIVVKGSDREFVLFSNDFPSVCYVLGANEMAAHLHFQMDIVVVLKQAHGTARRFESIEANDILAVARLRRIFDFWSDEE